MGFILIWKIFTSERQLLLLAMVGPQNYLGRWVWICKANWLSPSSAGISVCAAPQLFRRKEGEVWVSGFQTTREPSRGPAVLAGGEHCLTGADDSLSILNVTGQLSVWSKTWIENRKKIHNLFFTRNSWTKNKFYFYVIFTQLENSKNEMVKS